MGGVCKMCISSWEINEVSPNNNNKNNNTDVAISINPWMSHHVTPILRSEIVSRHVLGLLMAIWLIIFVPFLIFFYFSSPMKGEIRKQSF
jgi:uncharacterized membrane protein